MAEHSEHTDSTSSQINSLDRWKILCDLDLKSWQTVYNDLPKQLKDKGYKMITLYTASLATLPTLTSNTFSVMKVYWNSGEKFGAIFMGILLVVTIIALTMAIYHIVSATLKTREFQLFGAPNIRPHVENEEHKDKMIYQIITQHLEKTTKHNLEMYDEMLKDMNQSMKLFFSAVVIGFVLYFIVLIQQQFGT